MSSPRDYKDIYSLFAAAQTEKEVKMLFTDIFTPQEIDSLVERWKIVEELHKGTPQRSIAQKLGVSISKITRGSRAFHHGAGGFGYFLKKLKK